VVTYDIGVRSLRTYHDNYFDRGCVRLVVCNGLEYNFPSAHFFVVRDNDGEDLSYLMARLCLDLGVNAGGISYQVDEVVMPSVCISGRNLLGYVSCTAGDYRNFPFASWSSCLVRDIVRGRNFLRINDIYHYRYRYNLILGPMPILWNSNARFQLSVVYKIFEGYRVCFEHQNLII